MRNHKGRFRTTKGRVRRWIIIVRGIFVVPRVTPAFSADWSFKTSRLDEIFGLGALLRRFGFSRVASNRRLLTSLKIEAMKSERMAYARW